QNHRLRHCWKYRSDFWHRSVSMRQSMLPEYRINQNLRLPVYVHSEPRRLKRPQHCHKLYLTFFTSIYSCLADSFLFRKLLMYILEDLYRVWVLLLLSTGLLPMGSGIMGGFIALQHFTDITAGLHQGTQL